MYESPSSEEEVTAWLDTVVTARDDLTNAAGGMYGAIEALSSELGQASAVRTQDQLRLYHITPASDTPQVHGFLMYLKHCLFDGIASWQALGCFLQELALSLGRSTKAEATPLEWGTEFSRLARPVSDRVAQPWAPVDLHGNWPIVKRMNEVLTHPSVSALLPRFNSQV